jgi:hypothetical protein
MMSAAVSFSFSGWSVNMASMLGVLWQAPKHFGQNVIT